MELTVVLNFFKKILVSCAQEINKIIDGLIQVGVLLFVNLHAVHRLTHALLVEFFDLLGVHVETVSDDMSKFKLARIQVLHNVMENGVRYVVNFN